MGLQLLRNGTVRKLKQLTKTGGRTMSQFIQLHILTSYPPANLNRDDLGRPKTAVMGGSQRLRISSQSLKRAWRTSDLFEKALANHKGIRTKEIGIKVYEAITTARSLSDVIARKPPSNEATAGISEDAARNWAWKIASLFVDKPEGKTSEKAKDESKKAKSNVDRDTLKSEQLVFFDPDEINKIDSLINVVVTEKRDWTRKELESLPKESDYSAADLAMFGRMLASSPKANAEAAVQVAHAISVHEVAVEDDYFTAVDDLNEGAEDAGAAHIGETEFAAGLFYLYVCINRELLQKNLGDNKELAGNALKALTEAAAKIAPTGKQNSFASRARASYILAEKGDEQPRSLAVAYLKPVTGKDMLAEAIDVITKTRKNMDDAYGPCATSYKELNTFSGKGTLKEILEFVES
jgi:CRISPR system Cascade subunit CasC